MSFQLGRHARRATLALHVLAAVGWMGLDVGLAVLLVAANTTSDGTVAAAGFTAARLVVPVVVPVLATTMLVTGVVLGLGTRYGLVRWTWVVTKLVLGVVLTVLVYVALVPSALDVPAGLSGSARQVRDTVGETGRGLLFPPFVSFAALALALALSLWKPGGRTPWDRRRAERPAERPSSVGAPPSPAG